MDPTFRAALSVALFVWILGVGLVSLFLFRRRQEKLASAGGSLVLGPTVRAWYFETLRPLEEWLVRWRVSPTWLSGAQFFVSVAGALAFARGLVFLGGWFVLCGGSLDILDGRVARRTQKGSARGAFLDSVIDRYADAFSLLGLAAFYRESWVLWVVLFALVGGMLVSYARARAEGLGVRCEVGLLQRAERYVLLGFGAIFGSLCEHATGWHVGGAPYGLLVIVLCVLAVLSNTTALQRIAHVLRALAEENPKP
ncbi:MAG: CDP-diacylglycerol--inositol 3-phosphatidyltransferase [Candidatus Binatia bacterium]|nr:MAG: CDP-diacylglycerol--inositol 3-phosphatidyltransferase [Candidatus Binatia bacterium]